VLALTVMAIVILHLLSRKSEAKEGTERSAIVGPSWSAAVVAAALLLIAGTAAGLHYRQAHQRLGVPGVKVVHVPVYDPDGNLAGSNSVALPDRVLNFESTNIPIERVVLDWLPKDTTYGQRLYRASDGFQTQMTAVLMGADRTSIHQPQYCLEGSGWHIGDSELDTIHVDLPHSYDLPINKLTATKMQQGVPVRGIYVYWFVAQNRLTAKHGQRMFDMGLDMLRTGVLQRWAYVSCFSVCYPGQEQASYARIKELIAAAVPEFQLTTGEGTALARNP
jgi:hypothetical protein